MSTTRTDELERIAFNYHLNNEIRDKFIEDICQEHCCNWLQSLISINDRVVELGYGEGITIDRLVNKAAHYTLIEGAPSLVEVARQKHPGVEIIDSLFEDYEPSEPFDKLFALHVMEHVDDPIALAKRLSSWLKPNGEIILIVPNKESLHRRLAVIMGLTPELSSLSPRDLLVGHQRVYDFAGLEADLCAAGFEVLEKRGFFLKTLPNNMMIEHSPELIHALNFISSELPPEMLANIAIRAKKS
jgi:SAM-dependent methyltransferase